VVECLAALNDASIQTRRPFKVVAWTNEEGTRFQPGAMASSAFVGPALLESYKDTTAATASRSLPRWRRIVTRFLQSNRGARKRRRMRSLNGISSKVRCSNFPASRSGVVARIRGVRWYSLRCKGATGHAGITPMHARRDAP
jgi:N-carbamoyl-L-amino-acid hydrolase